MATPEMNENCHYVQNDPHRCEIKLEKFHFDILCCYGVLKESLPGGGPPPPSLTNWKKASSEEVTNFHKLTNNLTNSKV